MRESLKPEDFPDSAVKDAMMVLGGMPIDLAHAARKTDQAAKKWLRSGIVPNGACAYWISEATAAKGRRVAFEDLIGVRNRTPEGGARKEGASRPSRSFSR
jgi:hypothetical protein